MWFKLFFASVLLLFVAACVTATDQSMNGPDVLDEQNEDTGSSY